MATTSPRFGGWLDSDRRPLAVLLGTGFISLISNSLTGLAVPWFVLVLTGSATKMGVTAAATMLPSVIMMFLGGAIADRTNPRRLAAFSDVLSGVTVALVPLLYVLGYLTFPWLLALMVAGAIFDTPGYSARAKLIPLLADRGGVLIEKVTSVQGVFQAVSTLFGAILAGVLISLLGATNVLWINAAAFALSAITMLTLIPDLHTPREDAPSVIEDIKVGLHYVRNSALIRALIVAALGLNTLLTPLGAVLIPYLAKTEWDSATRFGLVISGFGAGAILGSLGAGALTERFARSTLLRVGLALLTLPVFLFVSLPSLPIAWTAAFLIGAGQGLVNPVLHALMYRITAPEILGRVQGVIGAGAMIASPLGVLLITPVLEEAGLSTTFLLLGAVLSAFGVWAIFVSPLLREVDAAASTLEPNPAGEPANEPGSSADAPGLSPIERAS